MAQFDRLAQRISRFFALLCGAMFTLIMLVMVREVVGRYFFDSPFVLVEDITTQLLLLTVFWGSAYVMSIKGFAAVDILYNEFPEGVRQAVDFLGALGGLAFLGVLFWQLAQMAVQANSLGMLTTTPAMIPLAVPYGGMLFGLLFFILETCRQAVGLVIALGLRLKGRA